MLIVNILWKAKSIPCESGMIGAEMFGPPGRLRYGKRSGGPRQSRGSSQEAGYSTTLKPKESTPSVSNFRAVTMCRSSTSRFWQQRRHRNPKLLLQLRWSKPPLRVSELSDERTEAKVDEAPHLPRKKSLHSPRILASVVLALVLIAMAVTPASKSGIVIQIHRRRFALSRFFRSKISLAIRDKTTSADGMTEESDRRPRPGFHATRHFYDIGK